MKKLIFTAALPILLVQFLMVTTSFAARNELTINYIKTDISCPGASNGAIELNISGGYEPYTVQWSNGMTASSVENLKKGQYSVVVTDAKGNTSSETIKIEMPAPISITYDAYDPLFLDGYNAALDIQVDGGTPWINDDKESYIVKLNGEISLQEKTTLNDGVYKISILDQRGCNFSLNVYIDVEEHPASYAFHNQAQDQTDFRKDLGIINLTFYKSNPPSAGTMEIFTQLK